MKNEIPADSRGLDHSKWREIISDVVGTRRTCAQLRKLCARLKKITKYPKNHWKSALFSSEITENDLISSKFTGLYELNWIEWVEIDKRSFSCHSATFSDKKKSKTENGRFLDLFGTFFQDSPTVYSGSTVVHYWVLQWFYGGSTVVQFSGSTMVLPWFYNRIICKIISESIS